jgi:hypothetical protein
MALHAAGVHHADVGGFSRIDLRQTTFAEQGRDLLGLIVVDAATENVDGKGAHGTGTERSIVRQTELAAIA